VFVRRYGMTGSQPSGRRACSRVDSELGVSVGPNLRERITFVGFDARRAEFQVALLASARTSPRPGDWFGCVGERVAARNGRRPREARRPHRRVNVPNRPAKQPLPRVGYIDDFVGNAVRAR